MENASPSTPAPYLVLLYYLYVDIDAPEAYRDQQRALCEELGLLGRIIVAKEGINGTVSGTRAACESYIAAMHAKCGGVDGQAVAHASVPVSGSLKESAYVCASGQIYFCYYCKIPGKPDFEAGTDYRCAGMGGDGCNAEGSGDATVDASFMCAKVRGERILTEPHD